MFKTGMIKSFPTTLCNKYSTYDILPKNKVYLFTIKLSLLNIYKINAKYIIDNVMK